MSATIALAVLFGLLLLVLSSGRDQPQPSVVMRAAPDVTRGGSDPISALLALTLLFVILLETLLSGG